MNRNFNLIVSAIFVVVGVVMIVKWSKVRGKVMIKDQNWSFMRMLFLTIGLLTLFSLIFNRQGNTLLDYVRMVTTLFAVAVFLLARDGVGEEGIVTGSSFIPWKKIRGWDYIKKKRTISVFFQVDISSDKKPDQYTNKELDFDEDNEDLLKEFLETNVRGKKMRMKKRA